MLNTVNDISDKSYQKRIWINFEGPEIDDFDETVCDFFQECDGILTEPREFYLTREANSEITRI